MDLTSQENYESDYQSDSVPDDEYDYNDSFLVTSRDDSSNDFNLEQRYSTQKIEIDNQESILAISSKAGRTIKHNENIPFDTNVETLGLDDLESLLEACTLELPAKKLPSTRFENLLHTPSKTKRVKKRPGTERKNVILKEKESSKRNITGRRFREQRDCLTRQLFIQFNSNIFLSKLPGNFALDIRCLLSVNFISVRQKTCRSHGTIG